MINIVAMTAIMVEDVDENEGKTGSASEDVIDYVHIAFKNCFLITKITANFQLKFIVIA